MAWFLPQPRRICKLTVLITQSRVRPVYANPYTPAVTRPPYWLRTVEQTVEHFRDLTPA